MGSLADYINHKVLRKLSANDWRSDTSFVSRKESHDPSLAKNENWNDSQSKSGNLKSERLFYIPEDSFSYWETLKLYEWIFNF